MPHLYGGSRRSHRQITDFTQLPRLYSTEVSHHVYPSHETGKQRLLVLSVAPAISAMTCQNVTDKPCGISPSVYVCLDPVPEIRPSSRAALLGIQSWTAPFGSPSATCLRWLDSETFRPPGTNGTEGSSEPICGM